MGVVAEVLVARAAEVEWASVKGGEPALEEVRVLASGLVPLALRQHQAGRESRTGGQFYEVRPDA